MNGYTDFVFNISSRVILGYSRRGDLRSPLHQSVCAKIRFKPSFAFSGYICVNKSARKMPVCDVFSVPVFYLFDIYLCANRSAVKAQPRTLCVLKCFAFWLTLTAYLFLYRFALLFSFFASASLFFRGLRPHPFAFCKKRGKNFCVLLLYVLYFSLCK